MPGRDGRETIASITEAEPLAPVTASTPRASEVGPETRPDVPPTDPTPAPATDRQPVLARLGSNPATEKSPELDFIEQDERPPRLQSFSDEGTSTGTVEQTVLDEKGPAMAAELAAKTAKAPSTQTESAAKVEAFAPRPRPSVPIPLYPRSGSSRSLPRAEIARREESTPEEGTDPGMPAHEEALESPPPSFVTSAAPLAPPSTTRSPASTAPPSPSSPSSPETTRDEHTERMDAPVAEAEALVATFGNAVPRRPPGPSPSDAGPIPFDPLFSVAGLASTNRSQRLALMGGVGFAVLVVLVLGIRAVSSSSSAAAAGSSSASVPSAETTGTARTPRAVVATPVGFEHASVDETAAASATASALAGPTVAAPTTGRKTDEEDPLGDVPSRVPAPAGRVPSRGGAGRPATTTRGTVRAGRP